MAWGLVDDPWYFCWCKKTNSSDAGQSRTFFFRRTRIKPVVICKPACLLDERLLYLIDGVDVERLKLFRFLPFGSAPCHYRHSAPNRSGTSYDRGGLAALPAFTPIPAAKKLLSKTVDPLIRQTKVCTQIATDLSMV